MQVPAAKLFHPVSARPTQGTRLGSGSRRNAQGLSHEACKLEVWLFNHSDLQDLICTWVWLAQPMGLPLGPDPVLETASGRSSGGAAAVAIEAGRRGAEGLAVHIYSYLDFQTWKGPVGSLSPASLPALASGETTVQRGEEASSGPTAN